MLKCPLTLAAVINTEFVHGAVIDCPGVSNIPLLEAFCHDVSKSGEIGASEFKICERKMRPIVVEIEIDAQVLLVVDSVIDPYRELVAAYGLCRHSADQRSVVWRSRNELKQINC